jgi:hypothetical protein
MTGAPPVRTAGRRTHDRTGRHQVGLRLRSCPPGSRSPPKPASATCVTEARRLKGSRKPWTRRSDGSEERAGRRLGHPADPLLVSVRSGARDSMPGMLDTVLNLGLNGASVEGLAARTGNERFAWDSYRRLVQMFGNVVRGIPGERFEAEIARLKAERGVRLDTELDAEALRELTAGASGVRGASCGARTDDQAGRRSSLRRSGGRPCTGDPCRVRLLERPHRDLRSRGCRSALAKARVVERSRVRRARSPRPRREPGAPDLLRVARAPSACAARGAEDPGLSRPYRVSIAHGDWRAMLARELREVRSARAERRAAMAAMRAPPREGLARLR